MIFFYVSLTTFICFLVLKYRKGIMLLNSVNNNLGKYTKKLLKEKKNLFLTPELLSIILIIVAVNTDAKITGICFVVFYTFMFLYFLKNYEGKFKFTKRNISLITILIILFLFINFLFYMNYLSFKDGFLVFDTFWMYYITLVFISYFSYIFIVFAEFINRPIELLLKKRHK